MNYQEIPVSEEPETGMTPEASDIVPRILDTEEFAYFLIPVEGHHVV